MTSLRQLTREHCATCDSTELFDEVGCRVCRTPRAVAPAFVREYPNGSQYGKPAVYTPERSRSRKASGSEYGKPSALIA